MIKRILSFILMLIMLSALFSISISAQAITHTSTNMEYVETYSYVDVLNEYYKEYVEYSTLKNPNIELMTFEEFYNAYYAQNTYTISEYITYLKLIIDQYALSEENIVILEEATQPRSSSGGSSIKSWYDIEDGKLPVKATYGKFDFSRVDSGDVLYEDTGFAGLTGHIAIVEKWAYDTTYGMNFIQLIEAVSSGVCRSYFDDDRFVEKKGVLYKVQGADDADIQNVLYFCRQQLGKPWCLQPFTKPTDIDAPHWQCSTMIWAAYQYVDIDIEQHGFWGGTGITPHDVRDADTTIEYLNYTQTIGS